MIKNKLAQVWIETVLYTIIGLAIIGIVLSFVMPKINQAKDNAVVEQSISAMQVLDERMQEVIDSSPGNRFIIPNFLLRKGDITFDPVNNKIIMTISDLKTVYSEPGSIIKFGKVNVSTIAGQKTYSVQLLLDYSSNIDLKYASQDNVQKLTAAPTPYQFSIEKTGVDANGKSIINIAESSGISSTSGSLGPTPTAPTSLSASAASSSQINLAWTDNSNNEAGFKIERSTDGTTFAEIATVGAGITSYSNTGLSGSTQYYYRVRAYNVGGNSAYSNIAFATTQSSQTTFLVSTIKDTSASGIPDSKFTVSINGNPAQECLGESCGGIQSPDLWTTYSVRITASTISGASLNVIWTGDYCSGSTNICTFTPIRDGTITLKFISTTPPSGSPASLTAQVGNPPSRQINLAWTDNSNNEQGFKIERSTDGVSFAQVGTAQRAASGVGGSYIDINLNPSTQYYYRVRAYNEVADSAYSNTASATTQSAAG